MRLLPVVLLVGCARSGMRAPGSFRHLSGDAAGYDSAPEEDAAAEPGAVQSTAPSAAAKRSGKRVARGAASLVGEGNLSVGERSFRYDCSGMVCAAYAVSGQHLSGSSRSLYADAEAAGVLHTEPLPSPGDVAFFDNSYDRNKNSRRDDPLTHVAVVEKVDEDGTITLVHLGSGRVGRIQMNLLRPSDTAVNSYLRATSDLDGGPRLTGELWRGFASFWALSGEQG